MAASVMPVQMCGRHAKCQTVIENTVQIFDIQIVLIHPKFPAKKAGRRHLIRIPYNHCNFLPLARVPTALQVGSCDASSNTTISNRSLFCL